MNFNLNFRFLMNIFFFQHEKKIDGNLKSPRIFFPLGEEFLKNFSHEWIIIIDWINCGREKMRNDGLNSPHQKFSNNPLDIFLKKIFSPWKDWIIMHFLSHENTFCPTKTASKMNKSYAGLDTSKGTQKNLELKCKILMEILVLWLLFA